MHDAVDVRHVLVDVGVRGRVGRGGQVAVDERAVYTPDESAAAVYDELFAEYTRLHDYFGRGGNKVMHQLRRIQRQAVSKARPRLSGSVSR